MLLTVAFLLQAAIQALAHRHCKEDVRRAAADALQRIGVEAKPQQPPGDSPHSQPLVGSLQPLVEASTAVGLGGYGWPAAPYEPPGAM